MKSGLMFIKLVNPCSGKFPPLPFPPPSPDDGNLNMFLNIVTEKGTHLFAFVCSFFLNSF